MANRPRGFGLTAELQKKKALKFDADLASECFAWMAEVFNDAGMGEEAAKVNVEITKQEEVVSILKDGTLLCKLINIIKPGSVKKINTQKMPFKQMENINNYLKGCETVGCKPIDLFQSVDLYESQNVSQVTNGIIALGRKAQDSGYLGPKLGPSEAKENKREFTEEQLRASDGIIGLQAGSNQGASQAGQNFGKTRSIID